jgi:glycosyltransferase 2 family protein
MPPISTPILGREAMPAKSPALKVLLTLVRLAIGIGLLVYLARSGIIDLRALSRLATAWPITLAAVSLLLFDVFLMSLRLSWLFRPQGLRLPLSMSLQLTLVGFFFAAFLPGAAGGDIAKSFYATRENSGRKTEIITVVILDRVIGLFSMLFLPLLFAPIFPQLIQGVYVLRYLLVTVAFLAACLLVGFLVCMWNQSILKLLGRNAFGFSRWRSLAVRGLETIRAYRHSPGTLMSALGASMLANLSLIGVTALGVKLVNPSGLEMKMCLVIPMGYIANSLPLTPGGLGVGEAAFNALFDITGLHGGAEALLCWRIWSLFVGILGLFFYLRGLRRSIVGMAEVQ